MKFEDIHKMSPSQLASFVQNIDRKMQSEQRHVNEKENQLATQIPSLSGGNLRDVNSILWPFFFSSSELDDTALILGPDEAQSTFVNITYEAGFVLTKIVKSVFEVVDIGGGVFEYNYINPKDFDNGLAAGLKFTIKDTQSSRTFHYAPIATDHIGDSKDPTCLDTPLYFSPNSNIEIKFYNNNQTKTYAPFFMFQGYRIRIDDSQEALGYVTK